MWHEFTTLTTVSLLISLKFPNCQFENVFSADIGIEIS
jgi:hypothetical protein